VLALAIGRAWNDPDRLYFVVDDRKRVCIGRRNLHHRPGHQLCETSFVERAGLQLESSEPWQWHLLLGISRRRIGAG
jgi:hypothetical protein